MFIDPVYVFSFLSITILRHVYFGDRASNVSSQMFDLVDWLVMPMELATTSGYNAG